LEVTTLIIPGKNDSEKELKQIAEFIKKELGDDTPWHVSRFFPYYKMKDVPPTPIEKIYEAVEIGKRAGLKYVYPGNV
jgi:pyruvate formate lyase activating enzyme